MSLSEFLRPKEFSELIQPLAVVRSLERMAKLQTPANMLFYGSPGVGKTSSARIMLSHLGNNWFEINGSLDNGVELVRTLRSAVNNGGLFDGPRVCFIDEADVLTLQAQAGLRAVIEGARSTFLLTANKIEKFQPALKSRCMPICFDVRAADAETIIKRLLPIYRRKLRGAGLEISEERLSDLLHFYFPDLRAVANRIEFEASPVKRIPNGT